MRPLSPVRVERVAGVWMLGRVDRDLAVAHRFCLFFAPPTLSRFGLAFFAAGLALRAPAARIAPARFWLIPCRLAIWLWAALKPMPFLLFAIFMPPWA